MYYMRRWKHTNKHIKTSNYIGDIDEVEGHIEAHEDLLVLWPISKKLDKGGKLVLKEKGKVGSLG